MKKLITLLLVLCTGVMQTSAVRLYFKPGTNWSAADAIFHLYYYDSTGANPAGDTPFNIVEGHSDYWYADFDRTKFDKIIILRLDPNGSGSIWDKEWNRSGNLDAPSVNIIYYANNEATGTKGDGSGFGYTTSDELNYQLWYSTNSDAWDSGDCTKMNMVPTTENGYEFSCTVDNQTNADTYYFMIISNSNINGDGKTPTIWDNIYFPVGTNPFNVSWDNYTSQNITQGNWVRWKIDNIPAHFTFTFNKIAATWSVSPYIERTIGAEGYATFSSEYDVAVPKGVTAYYATACETGKVTMTSTDDGIKSGEGAFLKGAAGTYRFTPAASTPSTPDFNYLVKGTDEGVAASSGSTWNYVFAKQGEELGFFEVNSKVNDDMTGKAYLQYTSSIKPTTDAHVAIIFDDEESTGIGATLNDQRGMTDDGVVYNLAGQRVAQPTKGLYIVNGKKVIIK